jgi:hypothetical protein
MEDHSMTRRQADLDEKLEIALRFQKIEVSLELLAKNLEKNTDSTKELLTAWNSSNWLLSFIKGAAVLTAAGLAIWYKFGGH